MKTTQLGLDNKTIWLVLGKKTTLLGLDNKTTWLFLDSCLRLELDLIRGRI